MAEDEANEAEDAEAGEEGEGEEGEKKKKKLSGKFLILFIVLPVLLLGGGGVGAAFMFGLFGSEPEVEGEEELAEVEPEEELPPPSFYELPEMIVNLAGGNGNRAVYLKLKVSLELRTEDPEEPTVVLDPIVLRIIDRFQVYLRQLRKEDLEGSAGMLRLKQELLRRINLASEPLVVHDVLFKEMIIQ